MGNYLNPGNEKFRRMIQSEIYVDKTGMIKYTNSVLDTAQNYVCVSRPRRFVAAVITAAVAAPVTFVIVLAMSTIVEIGANTTTNSIGKPSAANTAVDVIVAVPGTPTVPTDTTNVIRIRNAYCAIP